MLGVLLWTAGVVAGIALDAAFWWRYLADGQKTWSLLIWGLFFALLGTGLYLAIRLDRKETS